MTFTAKEAQTQLLEPLNKSTNTYILPVFATTFIGRKLKLNQVGSELLKPEVRLLTLLAQGGMGKTRLVVEVAKMVQDHFADGMCFASFIAVRSPEQIPLVLGNVLHYSFFGSESPQAQLLKFLKDKALLLILDNLEHLLQDTSFIHDILLAAPKIKILATSRESLNLQAEHLIELKGLNFLTSDSDAVKVFMQVAQNRQVDFTFNEETAPEIMRLCQLVEGMPLAS